MGTVILADVDELQTIKISELDEATSVGHSDVAPIVQDSETKKASKDVYLRNARFGSVDHCSCFESDGKLHFKGDARPIILHAMDSNSLTPSHHNPLEVTALDANTGISTDGLDTPVSANRIIGCIGVDSGINVKGRLSNNYVNLDATNESLYIKMCICTKNATWVQTSQWRVILKIATGTITGDFTIYMPAFNLAHYDSFEVFITKDGSAYAVLGGRYFHLSVAGTIAATEPMLNNVSAGPNVVVDVASTTGFYSGNKVFVSDDLNSEFARITSIALNSSVTLNSIANNYTMANNAKLDIIPYTRTASYRQVQRGMFGLYVLKAGFNSGVIGQLAIPHTIDETEDIGIALQFLPTKNNAGSATVRFRVQYLLKALGDDMPDSYQYGTSLYSTLTPPAVKGNQLHTLGAIPAAIHSGKHMLSIKLVREGIDGLDTYTGDIKIIAVIFSRYDKQLGYEA